VTRVASPFTGRVLVLDDVADDVFAQRVVGDGLAVVPTEGTVVAPIAGRIEKLFEGGHAFAIQDPDGVQILVHVGLDTVQLKGEGFTEHARQGDEVEVGDHIVSVDLETMDERGVDMSSPVVEISGRGVEAVASGDVKSGDVLFEVT
jgi:glucose-specific phosphotransferase system IIA component